mmetsp:Transcript_140758/g.245187  ORF Transcript_140758/g.245187 Transcript_140758/m.245187 type:complete len:393 (-) Transcript_140758:3811-4989(-)
MEQTFNDLIKAQMRPPYHLRRDEVLRLVSEHQMYPEEIQLDGTVNSCHNILCHIRDHVEELGERGPNYPNLGVEILTLLDRAYRSVDRRQNRPKQGYYGAGVRITTVWDQPYDPRRGAPPRTLLGIMVYKLGDLDPGFEAVCNPIEASDIDKAYLYYVVTRQNSIRGLGKSLMMLLLSLTDKLKMDTILNLAVDTPASFYEQFGFSYARGSKKRMHRPCALEPFVVQPVAEPASSAPDAADSVDSSDATSSASVPRLQSESPVPRMSTQRSTPTKTCAISPTRLSRPRGNIVQVVRPNSPTGFAIETFVRKRGRGRRPKVQDWGHVSVEPPQNPPTVPASPLSARRRSRGSYRKSAAIIPRRLFTRRTGSRQIRVQETESRRKQRKTTPNDG